MATIQTQPPKQPTLSSGRMKLSAVTSGRISSPMRIVVVGTEGVGKSTWAAAAPDPIFICPEDGTSHLDVKRFPDPETWGDVLDAIRTLAMDEHAYKTIVIDTLDWLEPMCWAEVCRKGNKPDVESFGYGRGYVAALDEWRILLSRLEQLRKAKGMNVILLAHSWIKPFKNPVGDDYDRFEMKLHAKAAGLIKEWSDAVLFAMHDELTAEVNGRAKGISSGARILRTQRTAAWDAKNRYDLPERLPLSWEDFAKAVQAGAPKSAADFKKEIEAALEKLADPKLTEQAVALVAKVGNNAADLAKLANRLQAKLNQ